MNPTLRQLDSWMASHNIESSASTESIRITSYTATKEPIASVHFRQKGSLFRDSDLERIELACNAIARELCIVPPRIALAMNIPSAHETD